MSERARARLEAAERYERDFVPAAFQESARALADAAEVGGSHRVLDVACGTGAVARECARRVGAAGAVTGLDISQEMLTVARRSAPGIQWVRGEAASLPFRDASFPRVVCQFALMLFPDKVRSVAEMWRVTARGGRLAASVSGRLDDSPVNQVLAELIHRQVGNAGLDRVNSVYALGDPADIEATFSQAGVEEIIVRTEWGVTRAASLEAFIETEIRGWFPLSELFDDDALESLTQRARDELAFAITGSGQVEFRSPFHTITAAK